MFASFSRFQISIPDLIPSSPRFLRPSQHQFRFGFYFRFPAQPKKIDQMEWMNRLGIGWFASNRSKRELKTEIDNGGEDFFRCGCYGICREPGSFARYVEMLHDMDFYLSFPWGREAYNQTIKRFGPVVIGNKPSFEDLKTRLRQSSTCCYGFPVALQLQVLETFPVICDRLKGSKDLRNFFQHPSESLTTNHLLRELEINKTELLTTVSVKYTVFTSEALVDDNLSWNDEVTDPKVDLVLSMLHEHHRFRPQE